MSFSVVNGPATFQNMMTKVLGDLVGKTCLIYIDDIIIWLESPEEHLLHIAQVMDRLAQHSLTGRLSKSHFCREYLE